MPTSWRTSTLSVKALDDNLAECLKLLTRLDAVVKNTLADDAPVIAEWNAARRLQRSSSRPSVPQPEPTPEPKPVQA